MKERSQLALLIFILLVIGAVFAYFTIYGSKFTFYKAEISINGNVIEEKLYYSPNKPYHTLYRDFETPIMPSYNLNSPSHIQVQQVKCEQGTPYYVDNDRHQYIIDPYFNQLLTYTDQNEYGCGFGNTLGFNKGEEYFISAKYVLNPDTLIEYEGKHYIKFVAYSGSRHPLLYHKTLSITGNAIYAKYVASSSEFLIYIPYEPSNIAEYSIIQESKLRTSNNALMLIIYMIVALSPAIICLSVWRLFGKEYTEGDYPEELSQYPKERKAWEVSVYFHPPFGNLDENFLPAMILDFYNRKIIDIQVKKTGMIMKSDEVFIKILPNNVVLDKVETEFMNFLKQVKSLDESKDDYFSIKSISSKFGKGMLVTMDYDKLKKGIKETSKEYIEYTGVWVLTAAIIVVLLLLVFISFFLGERASNLDWYQFYAIGVGLVIGIFVKKTSLFIRFKQDHYNEYQQWQGFKNYLSHLDSIPRTSYKGVVMWEKYLVYATCMGIGKEVLKQMRKLNIVNQQYYDRMLVVYTPGAFGAPTSSKSSGGMGGGGGIGGGGGGGR